MQSKSAYLTLTSYCRCCSCIENKKIEDWRVADERHNANAMVWNCQYYSKSLINKNLFQCSKEDWSKVWTNLVLLWNIIAILLKEDSDNVCIFLGHLKYTINFLFPISPQLPSIKREYKQTIHQSCHEYNCESKVGGIYHLPWPKVYQNIFSIYQTFTKNFWQKYFDNFIMYILKNI